jgi:hypothetical protein
LIPVSVLIFIFIFILLGGFCAKRLLPVVFDADEVLVVFSGAVALVVGLAELGIGGVSLMRLAKGCEPGLIVLANGFMIALRFGKTLVC